MILINNRKGIILAGGRGTRLSPITQAVSKQLIPIYDKPMVYYPLSTLMLSGVREILIITNPKDLENFKSLLSDGKKWGIEINYEVQPEPNGLAEAFLIGENFISSSPSVLALGDNLFHGNQLSTKLQKASCLEDGASIFAYRVNNPTRYGIIEFDDSSKVLSIEEKPKVPRSSFAVTGLYFYDDTVVERSKSLIPSSRGELEITDLNKSYLTDDKLYVELLGRGMVWLDTGTPDSLHEANSYIRTLEHRQGLKIGCPEEIAWSMGWITHSQLENIVMDMKGSDYGKYLLKLINN